MKTSRRDFLFQAGTGLAVLGSQGLLSGCGSSGGGSTPGPTGNPLRIPDGFAGGTLTATPSTAAIIPGKGTQVLTFQGRLPSPTIRVQRGQAFGVEFDNRIAEPTIIHWHGVLVPPDMDGHPNSTINPGETFNYLFDIDQRAATYWYHPHPHHITAHQIYLGMAGFFIIEDEEERALGLPSGEREVPLLIQDRRMGADGSLIYTPTDADHITGWLGDKILVNHTPDAFLNVSQSLYRFRILNGSNARVLRLGFADGRPFTLIGTDGGLLETPQQVTSVFLATAERVDILVDFSGSRIGDSLSLHSLAFSVPGLAPGPSGIPDQGADLQVLRFDVNRAGSAGTVPARLSTIERLDPGATQRTRVFELSSDSIPTAHSFSINGAVFDLDRVDDDVPFGSLETWEIQNTTNGIHPIHVHGGQFQVLSRTARAVAPEDGGWKDTVMTWPGETVRVLMRFDHFRGIYLFHCHLLEHEDDGMMINLNVF